VWGGKSKGVGFLKQEVHHSIEKMGMSKNDPTTQKIRSVKIKKKAKAFVCRTKIFKEGGGTTHTKRKRGPAGQGAIAPSLKQGVEAEGTMEKQCATSPPETCLPLPGKEWSPNDT